MILSKRTAEQIAEQLRDYLSRGRFAYVSVNETTGQISNFSTGHRLVADWTDRSPEPVRVGTHDDERIYISFSIAGFSFSIQEGERVYFDSGVKVRFTAPCGDERLDWLKLEGIDDND